MIRCDGCFKEYDEKYELCPHCGHIPGDNKQDAFQLPIGSVLLDRYVLGNVLGFGGFGITYKAWDKKLETVVAIKEYYPTKLVNRIPDSSKIVILNGNTNKVFKHGLQTFLNEAKNMCKFSTHKYVVNVFDYFEENNTAYIVMEFLDGCELKDYMHDHSNKISVERSLEIIEAVCHGLSDVHKQKIIHRDISPDNIYICKNGDIKLLDFGAARFSAEEKEQDYSVIIKPGFAPPEQYEKVSSQGPWTDIYAVGATLYYMLTGQKPEESTNRRISDKLLAPNSLNSEVPENISNSVMKAMALDRHMRFDSVDDFLKAIEGKKKVRSVKAEKRIKIMRRFIGVAAGIMLVVFAGFTFFNQMEDETLNPAELEFWFPVTEGMSIEESYDQIIADFGKAYKGVKIDAVAIPEKEYKAKIEKALKEGNAPDIFYSSGLSSEELKNTVDLSTVIYPQSDNWYYKITSIFSKGTRSGCDLLKNYDEYANGDIKQIPTSFNVPVVYVNTSLISFDEDTIADFDNLKEKIASSKSASIVIDKNMKQSAVAIFGEDILADNVVQIGDIKAFADGKAAFYISDTSEFYDVRSTGTYKIAKIDSGELPCEFHDMWSVAPSTADGEKAAKKFVEYLLSYNAQYQLYGKGDKIKALPINGDALYYYKDTFKVMGTVLDDEKSFSFEKSA